jgi:hypothetical protein
LTNDVPKGQNNEDQGDSFSKSGNIHRNQATQAGSLQNDSPKEPAKTLSAFHRIDRLGGAISLQSPD